MNVLLNRQFLESIGVNLGEEAYAALSEHYEETLHERVITEIVEELTEEQLTELHPFKSKGDEALREWLGANVPELKEIIEDEVAILLGEIAEHSDRL